MSLWSWALIKYKGEWSNLSHKSAWFMEWNRTLNAELSITTYSSFIGLNMFSRIMNGVVFPNISWMQTRNYSCRMILPTSVLCPWHPTIFQRLQDKRFQALIGCTSQVILFGAANMNEGDIRILSVRFMSPQCHGMEHPLRVKMKVNVVNTQVISTFPVSMWFSFCGAVMHAHQDPSDSLAQEMWHS